MVVPVPSRGCFQERHAASNVTSLSQTRASMKRIADANNEMSQRIHQTTEDVEKKVSALLTTINDLKTSLEEAHSQKAALEAKLRGMQKHNDRLGDGLVEAEQAIEDLEEAAAKQDDQLASQDKVIKDQFSKIEILGKDVDAATETNVDLTARIKQYEISQRNLTLEHKHLKALRSADRQQIDALSDKVSDSRLVLDHTLKHLEIMKSASEVHRTAAAKMLLTNEALKCQVKQHAGAEKELMAKLERANDASREANAKLEAADDANIKLRQDISRHEGSLAAHKSLMSQIQADFAGLQGIKKKMRLLKKKQNNAAKSLQTTLGRGFNDFDGSCDQISDQSSWDAGWRSNNM